MSDKFKIIESKGFLKITIIPKISKIVNVILIFSAIGILVGTLILGFNILKDFYEKPIISTVILFISNIFLLAIFNFYKKHTLTEIVKIDTENLTIIEKYWFFRKNHIVPLNEIIKFYYLGNLDNFDYQTIDEKMDLDGTDIDEDKIRFLIEGGTIGLYSINKIIVFGEKLPSWDAEELIETIKDFLKK